MVQVISASTLTTSGSNSWCGSTHLFGKHLRLTKQIHGIFQDGRPCLWYQGAQRLPFIGPSDLSRDRNLKVEAGWIFKRRDQGLDASSEQSENANEDILIFFFQLDLATQLQVRMLFPCLYFIAVPFTWFCMLTNPQSPLSTSIEVLFIAYFSVYVGSVLWTWRTMSILNNWETSLLRLDWLRLSLIDSPYCISHSEAPPFTTFLPQVLRCFICFVALSVGFPSKLTKIVVIQLFMCFLFFFTLLIQTTTGHCNLWLATKWLLWSQSRILVSISTSCGVLIIRCLGRLKLRLSRCKKEEEDQTRRVRHKTSLSKSYVCGESDIFFA